MYSIWVNCDTLRKVIGRHCSPVHYKIERINFSKYHPKHVQGFFHEDSRIKEMYVHSNCVKMSFLQS